MASDIHIRPRSRKDTVATVTTVSSNPPPIPPEHQQQQHSGPLPPSPTHLSSSPWTVSYSTLPMWRNKRNVKITYNPISGSPYKHHHTHQSKETKEQEETHLSDLVTYQSLTSNRIHSVRGIDKPTTPHLPKSRKPCPLLSVLTRHPEDPTPTPNAWTYTWRGSGYLKPFTSKWEILGYGSVSVERVKHDWLLTYFSETRLTPAGVDILFRRSSPSDDESGMRELPEQLISEIRRKLQDSEDDILKKLGGEIFCVKVD